MKWRECQFQGGEVPSLSSVPVFSTEGVVDSWRVSMLCGGKVVNAAGATMEREIAPSSRGGGRADGNCQGEACYSMAQRTAWFPGPRKEGPRQTCALRPCRSRPSRLRQRLLLRQRQPQRQRWIRLPQRQRWLRLPRQCRCRPWSRRRHLSPHPAPPRWTALSARGSQGRSEASPMAAPRRSRSSGSSTCLVCSSSHRRAAAVALAPRCRSSSRLLPTNCLLPTAYCLLPTTYHLLPTAAGLRPALAVPEGEAHLPPLLPEHRARPRARHDGAARHDEGPQGGGLRLLRRCHRRAQRHAVPAGTHTRVYTPPGMPCQL
eukprot:scaffold74454_cov65-Phaeocystis_antarctica.AAC.3